jgi:hypothetical protein
MTLIEQAMERMAQQPRAASAPERTQQPPLTGHYYGNVAPALHLVSNGSNVPVLPTPARHSAHPQRWAPSMAMMLAGLFLVAALMLAGVTESLDMQGPPAPTDAVPVLSFGARPAAMPSQAGPMAPERAAAIPSASLQAMATPSATASTGARAEIEASVRDWAAAWSGRDVERYLGFYATQFVPAKGSSRSDWEAERRQRILGKQRIAVVVDDLAVQMLDDQRAKVTFAQSYEADQYRESRVPKTLVLVRESDSWRIEFEVSANKAEAKATR